MSKLPAFPDEAPFFRITKAFGCPDCVGLEVEGRLGVLSYEWRGPSRRPGLYVRPTCQGLEDFFFIEQLDPLGQAARDMLAIIGGGDHRSAEPRET